MTRAYTRPEDATTDVGTSKPAPKTIAAERTVAEREELEQIGVLIENAHTLSEVEAVQERLHAWVIRCPGEKERLADVFEQLSLMQDSAREAQLEAAAMHLSPEEIQQREEVFALRRHVRAEDPPTMFGPALRVARKALEEWKAAHPEDPQFPYLHEVLDTEESVALSLHG